MNFVKGFTTTTGYKTGNHMTAGQNFKQISQKPLPVEPPRDYRQEPLKSTKPLKKDNSENLYSDIDNDDRNFGGDFFGESRHRRRASRNRWQLIWDL